MVTRAFICPFYLINSREEAESMGCSRSLQVILFGKLISFWVYCSHPWHQWHLLQYNLVLWHFQSGNTRHRFCYMRWYIGFLCALFNSLSLAPSKVLSTELEVNAESVNKERVKISGSGYIQNQIQILTLTHISYLCDFAKFLILQDLILLSITWE